MKIFTINNRKVVKLSLNDLLKRKDQFSNKSDHSTLIIFDEFIPNAESENEIKWQKLETLTNG